MPSYIVTPRAAADLAAIQLYLQSRSMDASERVGRKLVAAFELLAEHPHIGHARPDLTDRPYRFWPVQAYLVVYWVEAGPVRIVRVLHGALDVQGVFGQEG